MPDWPSSETLLDVLFAAWLIWAITAVVGILAQRRSPVATLAWTLALLLMPYVGALIYVGFGPRRLRRRRLRYLAASDEVVRAVIDRLHATRSGATFDGRPGLQQLVRASERLGEGAPVRADSVTLYREGDESYQALERAIRAARHHVHLEYYIWESDPIGTRLRDALCERAAAGVAVRVLLDGVGSGLLGSRFWDPLVASGGQVAWFNAFGLWSWRPHLFNFRTHRKLVICDGHIGFTGGINISARHSVRQVGATAWRDTHVRIVGEPVRKLQRVFLEDWFYSNPSNRPRPEDIDHFFPASPPVGGPWTQVIASGPDDNRAAIHRFYFGAIVGATQRIWLTTAYFVPDDPTVAALTDAALRGVDVRLLVPLRGDSRLVSAASRSFYDEMATAGVSVHEYTGRMLHAKTLLVDQDIAVVGTANIDNRSFRLNFELIAVMYDAGVAAELAEHFRVDLESARQWRKPSRKRLRRLSVWYDRFLESLARLFSPLL
jgi:cardiolipin synthase